MPFSRRVTKNNELHTESGNYQSSTGSLCKVFLHSHNPEADARNSLDAHGVANGVQIERPHKLKSNDDPPSRNAFFCRAH